MIINAKANPTFTIRFSEKAIKNAIIAEIITEKTTKSAGHFLISFTAASLYDVICTTYY